MNPDKLKPIGILTNDYDYAESWLFENRDLDHLDSNNRLYTDSSGQRYLIRDSSRKFLGYELLAVFIVENPSARFISNAEVSEAKSRVR